MDYINYAKMAKEYLQQASVLDEKIKKRTGMKIFPSAQERELNERAILSLYEMKREVMAVHHLMRKRAAEMGQEDINA
ncbi:MAG: hypothetical protein IIY78_01385 [Clostridia bacterium]|nr:hypothetical protein [Clostridia bacterium]